MLCDANMLSICGYALTCLVSCCLHGTASSWRSEVAWGRGVLVAPADAGLEIPGGSGSAPSGNAQTGLAEADSYPQKR